MIHGVSAKDAGLNPTPRIHDAVTALANQDEGKEGKLGCFV
jgi:hypothetical protein